jgi:Macrocin-O-methyltransferase (TylF)
MSQSKRRSRPFHLNPVCGTVGTLRRGSRLTPLSFLVGEGKANCGDLPRLYSLLLNVARVKRENIPGNMAALGVYQGNTARILAEAARSSGRRLYLFDTFAGLHSRDLRGPDRVGVAGHFGDTSLEKVKAFVGTHGVEYIVGRFPTPWRSSPCRSNFPLFPRL